MQYFIYDQLSQAIEHGESRNVTSGTALQQSLRNINAEYMKFIYEELLLHNVWHQRCHLIGNRLEKILYINARGMDDSDDEDDDQWRAENALIGDNSTPAMLAHLNDGEAAILDVASVTNVNITGERVIRFQLRNQNTWQSISGTRGEVEPLSYPLLFFCGENGWDSSIRKDIDHDDDGDDGVLNAAQFGMDGHGADGDDEGGREYGTDPRGEFQGGVGPDGIDREQRDEAPVGKRLRGDMEIGLRGLPHAHIVCRLTNMSESGDDEGMREWIKNHIRAVMPRNGENAHCYASAEYSLEERRSMVDRMMKHTCYKKGGMAQHATGKGADGMCKKGFDNMVLNDSNPSFDRKGFPMYGRQKDEDLHIVSYEMGSTYTCVYLYKYIFKGSKKEKFRLKNAEDTDDQDELNLYLRGVHSRSIIAAASNEST